MVPNEVVENLSKLVQHLKENIILKQDSEKLCGLEQVVGRNAILTAFKNQIDGYELLNWQTFLSGWSSSLFQFFNKSLSEELTKPRPLGRCTLCGVNNTVLVHILANCTIALNEGRYSYRHDNVLKIIRQAISHACALSKKNINLQRSILSNTNDWKILMDQHENHYALPPELFCSHLRPDIILYSIASKSIIIIELTVPWEVNIPIQHLSKTLKYREMITSLELKGFNVKFYALEVGARGFPSKLLHQFFVDIGMKPEQCSYYLNWICRKSVECSYHIWCRRKSEWTLNTQSQMLPFTRTTA